VQISNSLEIAFPYNFVEFWEENKGFLITEAGLTKWRFLQIYTLTRD